MVILFFSHYSNHSICVVVNILAFDFDPYQINPGTKYSTLCITAAKGAYKQLQSLGLAPATTLGITVKPGQQNGDTSKHYFTAEDAGVLYNWQKTVKWVSLVSIWNANADEINSSAFSYSHTFVQVEN